MSNPVLKVQMSIKFEKRFRLEVNKRLTPDERERMLEMINAALDFITIEDETVKGGDTLKN